MTGREASGRRGATIELLAFDGCSNHAKLLGQLTRLLEREGIEAQVVLLTITDDVHARAERFLGSPTIRVDGRDVDPSAVDRVDYGVKCGVYRSGAGLTGVPSDAWILAALAGPVEDRL